MLTTLHGIKSNGDELVILTDFALPSRVNQRWQYSGIDSLERCQNQQHFLNYPHPIVYQYNSRGFRDTEWPESLDELKNAIWCVGDSFTVGIGQPFDHTWPQLLSKTINKRTINVSMDGASNDWIARKVRRIVDVIDPVAIIILWSYTHRSELEQDNLDDEQRRLFSSRRTLDQDNLHWIDLSNQIQSLNKQIIQATIPNFQHINSPLAQPQLDDHWNKIKGISWPGTPKTLDDLKNLPEYIKQELKSVHCCYEYFVHVLTDTHSHAQVDINTSIPLPGNVVHVRHQLDWARDRHHFGESTANWLVQQLIKNLDC
jgi:hypothetical protein